MSGGPEFAGSFLRRTGVQKSPTFADGEAQANLAQQFFQVNRVGLAACPGVSAATFDTCRGPR